MLKKARKKPLDAGDFKPLVRKTRRPRGTVTPKELTKLTHAQFASRHEYCINVGDIKDYIAYYNKRAEEQGTIAYIPKDTKAVCNHPEDGICSHNPITDAQLAEVNAHLDGTWEDGVDLEIQPMEISYIGDDGEIDHMNAHLVKSGERTGTTEKPKRGRPPGSKNKPKVRITGGSTIVHKGIMKVRK